MIMPQPRRLHKPASAAPAPAPASSTPPAAVAAQPVLAVRASTPVVPAVGAVVPVPAVRASAAAAPLPSPVPASPIPTTMIWKDKHQILGALLLIAEALGRQGEELADRLAWNTVIDMGFSSVSQLRKSLGELRVVHSTFTVAVDNRLLHAAIVLLLRVTSFAQLAIDLAAQPFSWMLDRHIQEIGFVCDFASFLLEPHSQNASLSVPALYANETWVRAVLFVAIKTSGTATLPHNFTALHKNVHDQAQSCSNVWLKRQLQRMAAGLKVACSQEETGNLDVIISQLAKDRALAIQAYAKKHGHEAAMTFDDPLFDLRDQLGLAAGGIITGIAAALPPAASSMAPPDPVSSE